MPRLFRRLCRVWRFVVSESFDREGMETLAGAICTLAAGAHSKNPADQEQIAATFFNCAITGFEGIRPSEAVELFVRNMIQSATKKSK